MIVVAHRAQARDHVAGIQAVGRVLNTFFEEDRAW